MEKKRLWLRPNFDDPKVQETGELTLCSLEREPGDPNLKMGYFVLHLTDHETEEKPEESMVYHRLRGRLITGEDVSVTLIYDDITNSQEYFIEPAASETA